MSWGCRTPLATVGQVTRHASDVHGKGHARRGRQTPQPPPGYEDGRGRRPVHASTGDAGLQRRGRRCRMDTVYVIRLVVGLAMTVAALAVSGRRAHWLYRLIRIGPAGRRPQGPARRAPARAAGGGVRPAQAAAVVRAGPRAPLHVLGLRDPASVYLEAYGALFDPGLPHPADRPLAGAGVPAGHDRGAGAGLARRLRGDPDPQRARAEGAGVPVLRLAHRRGLADPLHDLQRAVDDVPVPRREPRRWACFPTVGGVGVDRGRPPASPGCRPARWRCSRASGCCCTSA